MLAKSKPIVLFSSIPAGVKLQRCYHSICHRPLATGSGDQPGHLCGLGDSQLWRTLLVTDTVMYDIFERMGDSQQAVNYYRSELNTDWIGTDLPENTRRAPLASADQDIDFRNFQVLTQEFGVPAADWESAAIAWVLKANGVSGLILRGVSDIITPFGSETDNNHSLWHSRVEMIMRKLMHDLPFYLENFLK